MRSRTRTERERKGCQGRLTVGEKRSDQRKGIIGRGSRPGEIDKDVRSASSVLDDLVELDTRVGSDGPVLEGDANTVRSQSQACTANEVVEILPGDEKEAQIERDARHRGSAPVTDHAGRAIHILAHLGRSTYFPDCRTARDLTGVGVCRTWMPDCTWAPGQRECSDD